MGGGAWSFRWLLVITVALQVVVVTMAAPAADLISSLPGQPSFVSFEQYAGYITVNQAEGRKLFYYFVEAENSSSTQPLVLWLNGGPGCSSIIGAFTELGPFYPNTTGTGLNVNSNSWNKVANVIFLESPAGVGFSNSNSSSDYFTDDERTGDVFDISRWTKPEGKIMPLPQDALAFLLGWLAEYPEYKSNDFYITGESYAGHYVPHLAAAIVRNNNIPGQAQIALKGIMIGNPLLDSVLDLQYSPLEFGWSHGMVSEAVHNTLVQECDYTTPNRSQACIAAEGIASLQMGFNSSYFDPYDVLADVCITSGVQAVRLKAAASHSKFDALQFSGKNSLEDPCIGYELTEYLNRPDVQTALHAEATVWEECFNGTYYNSSSIAIPMSPVLTDLVNSNLRVWIYTGDLDTVISIIGTRKLLNILSTKLNWKITSDYQLWFQGSQIGGWSISWGSVVYATVRGASHMVPASQPARALVLFSSFLAGAVSPPLQPT